MAFFWPGDKCECPRSARETGQKNQTQPAGLPGTFRPGIRIATGPFTFAAGAT